MSFSRHLIGFLAMEASQVEVGAVFRFSHDERPLRILVRHEDVVMYDVWRPHINGWGLADLQAVRKQPISYYVATVPTVTDKATYLRSEPLADGEMAVHRPDLPFYAARCNAVPWPAEVPLEEAELARWLRAADCLEGQDDVLNASEIYVSPFGSKGGEKGGVRIKADNETFFTKGELLHKAAIVQAPHLGKAPPQGMGLFRSGLQRGIPSYYLWGYRSRMHDHIAAWEVGNKNSGHV